jgi:hypothetical protein
MPLPRKATTPGFQLMSAQVPPCVTLTPSRTSTISPLTFRAYSPSLPLLAVTVLEPPKHRLRASHVSPSRRNNAPLHSTHTARLPPHCRFQGTEIPKHLPYSRCCIVMHGQTRKVTAHCSLPHSIVNRRRYTLKLCRDPSSLRRMVPSVPAFASHP